MTALHSDPRARRATPAETVREARAIEAAKTYVAAIAALEAGTGQARMAPLAIRLGVSTTTAIKAVRRLERRGLVTHLPYSPVVLTEAGRAIAARTHERQTIIRDFLMSLGLSVATATLDAHAIEHHLSDETLAVFSRRGSPDPTG